MFLLFSVNIIMLSNSSFIDSSSWLSLKYGIANETSVPLFSSDERVIFPSKHKTNFLVIVRPRPIPFIWNTSLWYLTASNNLNNPIMEIP